VTDIDSSEQFEPEAESLVEAGSAPPRDLEEVVRWGRVALSMGAILVVGVLLAGVLIATKKTPPRSSAKPSLTGVRVFLAETREIQSEVVGLGRVRPRRRVTISAQVGGVALEVHPDLRDGSFLDAGTLAVQIDRADHDAALRRAIAQADSARAEVARVEAQVAHISSRIALATELLQLEVENLERTKDLFTKSVRTDRDVESANLTVLRGKDALLALQTTGALLGPQLAGANARVSEAVASQATAKLKLDRCTIRLPFSGQVAKVAVEEHQLLSPGQALFELWQVDVVEVPVALSLADATLLSRDLELRPKGKSDESVSVKVEHEGNGETKEWEGGLLRFEPIHGPTQTVKAVVSVSNPADRSPLFPDVFCRVTLKSAQVERGLAIPINALQERDRVYVVRDGKLVILSPTLGKRIGSWVFVTAGIERGEQLIVSPLEKVVEGVPLSVVETLGASQ
jgi:multidrug efflux pump subunit AcrA (membrane-fusion protein)